MRKLKSLGGDGLSDRRITMPQALVTIGELSARLKKSGRLVAPLPYINGHSEFIVLYGQTDSTWFEYRLVAQISATEEGPIWSQHRSGFAKVFETPRALVESQSGWYCSIAWSEPEIWGIDIPLPAGRMGKQVEPLNSKVEAILASLGEIEVKKQTDCSDLIDAVLAGEL